MNRLEREVLEELEADYEFDEDRAVAIVALVREAVEQEIKDKEPDIESPHTWEVKDFSVPMPKGVLNSQNKQFAHLKNYGSPVLAPSRMSPSLSNPTIRTSMDTLRQHIDIHCDCGWGIVVSVSIPDYNKWIKQEVNKHGKDVHGIDFAL